MTPIEILATLLAVVILIKLFVVFLIGPKKWLKVAETLLQGKIVTMLIYLVLAGVVGYYLFQEVTIIQFAASMLLLSLLIGLGWLPFAKDMQSFMKKALTSKEELFRKVWLQLIIWVGISIWILVAVFR